MYRKFGPLLLIFILGLNTNTYTYAECHGDWGLPKTTTQKDILCPIAHFYKHFAKPEGYRKQSRLPTEELFQIEFDIDQDGHKDLLISANYMHRSRQGEVWLVYFKRPTGYQQLEELIGFNQHSYGIRKHPTQKAAIINSYCTRGGGEGDYLETIISPEGYKGRTVHKFQYWKEEDEALSRKLFEENKKTWAKAPVKKMPFSEVEKYLENPAKCKHKTYTKPNEETP